jgi:hypothetical protein
MATVTPSRKRADIGPEIPPAPAPQPVAEPAAKRNGRGPAAPRQTAAAAAGLLPANVDPWDWLSEFSNDEWQNLIAYLWRVSPITDRRFAGKASHIRKYAARFDLERIMLDEGSGGYRIDLVRIDPASGKQGRIAQWFFQIMNMSYPPRVPAGEWVNDPDNEMWKWAEPALRAREASEEIAADQAAAGPGPFDPNAMFNTVLNGMKVLRGESSDNTSLASSVLAMVQNNQTKMMELSDPTKQLTTLKELLHTLTPAPNTEGSLIITILRDELKATRDEMRELRNQAAKPGNLIDDLIEKAPKLQELARFLGFSKGRSAGEGTDWGEVAIRALDKIADNVPLIVEGIRGRQAQPNAGFEMVRREPAAAPADATPAADAAPQPAGSSEEQERTRLQAILNKYQQLISAVAPFLIDQYKSGLTGYDFRDWFISRHGILNWTGLKDECGADDLTKLAQLHPHLKVALAPPDKLLAFLQDVFTEPGQERTAPESEPAAAGQE